MATTATKSKFKPTINLDAAPQQAEVHAQHDASQHKDVYERLADAGIVIPTSRRVLLSMVTGFVTSAVTSYLGCQAAGWVAGSVWTLMGGGAQLAIFMAGGPLALTWGCFLASLIAVLGAVIAVLAAIRAGMAATQFVLGFSMTQARDTCTSTVDAAKDVGSSLVDALTSKISFLRRT